MNNLENTQNKNIGLLIQRISIGLLILLHGIANLTSDYSFIKSLLKGFGVPEFVAYSVFVGEIIAPILLILGWRTKMASLLLFFNMLTVIIMAHSADIFTLNQFGGWGIELQGLYLFGALQLVLLGAGEYAVSTTSKWD